MENRQKPILVFDSGLGGISVLRELARVLPRERFVYFGDSANAPYGPRDTEEIRALTMENLSRLDARFGFKAAVIACNTATSAAITALRAGYPDRPIVGIEPAVKLAADRHPGGTILVLATETTLREEKYVALTRRMESCCRVVGLATPELVEFVEQGRTDDPEIESYFRKALAPYVPTVDAVVLGCTHFPFVRAPLMRVLGQETEVLDGSAGTARQTMRLLARSDLLSDASEGSVEFYNSKPGPRMLELSCSLFRGETQRAATNPCKGSDIP